MKDERDEIVVKAIAGHIRETLTQEFQYCGVAEGGTPEEGFIMLNSGKGCIKISITWERSGW
jgi:hypothetical protein